MRLRGEVGIREKHLVEFRSNALFGTVSIRLNDRPLYWTMQVTSPEGPVRGPCEDEVDVIERQPYPYAMSWEFNVGNTEPHRVTITRSRPRWLSIFRPHRCRIEVDSEVVAEQRGY